MGTYLTQHNKCKEPTKPQSISLLLMVLMIFWVWVVPAGADVSGACVDCHGNFADIHGNVDHTAVPANGVVALFPDFGHDDAGHTNPSPQFGVTVHCAVCHNTYLPLVHGNDCSTCHPTPFDTLKDGTGASIWARGCQQGGCHTSFHDDVIAAHGPFEDPGAPHTQCIKCHNEVSWDVVDTNCTNCHAAFNAGSGIPSGYVSTPVTTTNAQATYVGTAKINFSITEGGKVAIGRTFYSLDGAPEVGGMGVIVSAPGSHSLQFWSVDQAGNKETTGKSAYFTVNADTTPPTTTSDAKASYSQGGKITLSATDDSTLGVKNTYFSLNGGATQTGTVINLPATSGTVSYTLEFWSEDWAGNVEAHNIVSFVVTSGNVTLRLVWADCDIYPANAPASGDSASWTIRKGSFSGPLVKSGSAASPDWSGINDVVVPYSTTPYYVRIDWYYAAEDWDDQTDHPNIDVSTPGQTIRLSY